jgi:hypothetical protein
VTGIWSDSAGDEPIAAVVDEIAPQMAARRGGMRALPITTDERDFKVTNGLEALERRFEEAALEYWDTQRASVV